VITDTVRPLIRRRSLAGLLAAGAVLAGAGIGATGAAAAGTAQVAGGTLIVSGDRGADRIALRLETGVPTRVQVDFGDDGTADATVDRATFDRIAVRAGRGDDTVRIDDANGTFTDTEITTISGDRGDDTMLGGGGNELFFGGPGDDVADGNRGADVGVMGAGDDTFIWDPGDGSDVVEGQRGYDTMDFNGADGAETFAMSPNGPRLRFLRQPGNIVMDTDGVERVDVDALGGTDALTIDDLSGTDVFKVRIDLAAALGGTTGDATADTVVVNATAGGDEVDVRPRNGHAVVRGLAATIAIAAPDPTLDTLTVNMLGGEDAVRLGAGLGGLIRTTVNA
jgi:RTX calcium-binding nonapeptide repeat (4 copies)